MSIRSIWPSAWLRTTESCLLNGGGFDAPDWSLRVSLANLDDEVYEEIGRGVRSIARGYRDAYEAQKDAQKAKKQEKSATKKR